MAATIQVNDIWITRKVYEDAERIHYENLAKDMLPSIDTGAIKFLEKQVLQFQKTIDVLQGAYKRLEERLLKVEQQLNQQKPAHETKQAPAQKQQDDDNVDLFASDSEEDEAAAKVREERLAAYNAKKAKKPVLIAKSNVILDVKPWDDETDMKAMEVAVRKIEADGLLWGAAKLVPLAYGIQKLQISCVVEDDKVSIDWLTEQIESLEDFVQSVDIAAFNKI